MFTGAKPDDIIRQAAERAAAKEPPATFLGREGSTMQREVETCLPQLRASPPGGGVALKDLLTDVVAFSADEGRAPSLNNIDGNDAYMALFTGVLFMLRIAVKQRTRIADVRKDLKALNVDEAFTSLFARALEGRRDAIEKAANEARIRHPHLDRFKWRCDVTISSTKLKRVLKPCVTMQMTLSDGSIKSFEVPIEKFHALRYNVAKVLQHMQELEAHPMMRIMDALEEEERKKMKG